MAGLRAVVLLGLVLAARGELVWLERDQAVLHTDWKVSRRAEPHEAVQLTFALKHNPRQVEDALWELEKEVANPDSEKYSHFWSNERIDRTFAPDDATVQTVQHWITSHDIDDCRRDVVDFMTCDTTVKSAEQLLQGAKFHWFDHKTNRMESVIRSKSSYQVPEEVARCLDFIGGVHRFVKVPERPAELDKLFDFTTPSKLRSLYNMTSEDVGTIESNTQSVAQFLDQFFHPADLAQFMGWFADGWAHMEAAEVVGSNPWWPVPGTECTLDVEYVMSTGANVTTQVWSTRGRYRNQEPMLDWVLHVANASVPPYVISVSYGDLESAYSAAYMRRLSTEFGKLGLRGVSVLFASGDAGAGCAGGVQGSRYTPVFPATSPYVTSVGATSLVRGEEIGVGFSSGGFSDVFPRPEYQHPAVERYLNRHDLPDGRYDNTSGRAFPDVSALGVKYVIVIDRVPEPGISGTSASSPVVAGMFAVLNDFRLRAGKERLGFVNPLLYGRQEAMKDVSSGCSAGCHLEPGFCAVAGWDPVTGLGTPRFGAWRDTLLLE